MAQQRNAWTAKQKLDALDEIRAGKRRALIMKELNVGASTLSEWVAKYDQIKQQVDLGSGH